MFSYILVFRNNSRVQSKFVRVAAASAAIAAKQAVLRIPAEAQFVSIIPTH